ncbi:MAG: L,D-transpeptidase family protein [Bacillota bacterium]
MIDSSRFLRLIYPNMTGPDVREVIDRLRDLGFYRGESEDTFDRGVSDAVVAFQISQGLIADGIVGRNTWLALRTVEPGTTPPPSEYTLTIDQDAFTITLTRRGEIQKRYRCAVGKPATPTPPGDWYLIQKTPNPGGPFGPRWMRLNVPYGGYGIHGTDNPSSIGTAASHGCVRMVNEQVIELYDIVPLGTQVRILPKGQQPAQAILRVGSSGPEVWELQQRLQVLGFFNAEPTGYFGTVTEQAVITFQEAKGLIPDGLVGTVTREAIEKAWDQVQENRQP